MGGFAGGFHNMACFSLSRELNSYGRAPGAITVLLSALLLLPHGLAIILLLPKFIFAGMLVWVGLKFLRIYLFQPAVMLKWRETAVIVSVAVVMKFVGFSAGLGVGLVLAMAGIVSELASMKAIHVVADLSTSRSHTVRSVQAERMLHTVEESVLVMRLAPGFVFFATSSQLIELVERRMHYVVPEMGQDPLGMDELEDDSDEDCLAEKQLQYVVIDFTLCSGFDGSLIGVLQRLAALGCRRHFNLCLAGVNAENLLWLKNNTTNCSFFPDLDRTLQHVEDKLLQKQGFMVKEQKRVGMVTAGRSAPLATDEQANKMLAADGWKLLMIFCDRSPLSRSVRPVVGRAGQLLEGRCDLFEASAEHCPELASTFRPVPALVLLKGSERVWSTDFTRPSNTVPPSPPQSAWRAQRKELVEPLVKAKVGISAEEIAKEVQHEIFIYGKARNESATTEVMELVDSAVVQTVKTAVSESDSKHETWVCFLALNGLPRGGHLAHLTDRLRSPRVLSAEEVLFYKGAARNSLFFVVSGLLSLYNEGEQFEQVEQDEPWDVFGRQKTCGSRVSNTDLKVTRIASNTASLTQVRKHQEMLSQGTSRLLRIGPGWTLGGLPPCAVMREGVMQSRNVQSFTCKAETTSVVLELCVDTATVLDLRRDHPDILFALVDVVADYTAALQERCLAQLSDWNTLIFD